MRICQAGAGDGAAIETLLDATFGPERHARTAYRLREGATPIAAVSLVARARGTLVGSVQYWPVELAGAAGEATPLTLLGPIVIAQSAQGQGTGTRLMRESLARVDALGLPPVVLVGDPEYYERFGFSADATSGWTMPGPFEARRLLLRAPAGAKLPAQGALRATVLGRRAAA